MTREAALAFSAAISGFALPAHCSQLLSPSCGCLESRAAVAKQVEAKCM